MLTKYELPLTLKITFVQNCAIPKLYFHLQTLPVVIAERDFLVAICTVKYSIHYILAHERFSQGTIIWAWTTGIMSLVYV